MMIPNICILMASLAQSAEPGFQISNPSETFALKANVFSLINNLLKQDQTVVVRAALPAVLHTILVEVRLPTFKVAIVNNLLQWYWGNTASVWAHLEGAKQIIKLQGGLERLNYPILQQGITL
jgi:hypothetical protein